MLEDRSRNCSPPRWPPEQRVEVAPNVIGDYFQDRFRSKSDASAGRAARPGPTGPSWARMRQIWGNVVGRRIRRRTILVSEALRAPVESWVCLGVAHDMLMLGVVHGQPEA